MNHRYSLEEVDISSEVNHFLEMGENIFIHPDFFFNGDISGEFETEIIEI